MTGLKSWLKRIPLHARHTFYYDLRSAALFGLFGGLIFPFMAIVGRKIGATNFHIALIASAPYVSNAFALLWTEDILGTGRVWYVVWPNALGRALLVLMFFVISPLWYAVLIFVYMLVTAPAFPSYASIMKTNYPEPIRARLMSYVRAAIAFFWIIASAAAGWYLQRDTYNYRYLFPFAATLGFLSALQFRHVRIRREKKERESIPGFDTLTMPLKDPAFLKFLAVYSVFEFGLLLANPVYPLVLVDEAHISNFAAGIYGSVFSSLWLLGFFFWGHFIDRYAIKSSVLLVFLSGCFVPFIYLITRSVFILGIAQGMSGFLMAGVELAGYIVITRMARPKDVPRYMAAHVALQGVRGAAAPFLGTRLYPMAGADTVFGLSLILGAFSIFIAWKVLDAKA